MGVSGSGKTTIGIKLAKKLDLPFVEADDYHPESNIKKMASGIPLTDQDRIPWLQKLSSVISHYPGGCVLACSALKGSYRNILASRLNRPMSVFLLQGPREVIEGRMEGRDHFMPPRLLESQLETLELSPDIHTLDIQNSPDQLVDEVIKILNIERS